MEGFKLKKSKILRKILSNDNIYGENKHQHLSEAGLHSSRLSQTSYESKRSLKHHHDKTKYENRPVNIFSTCICITLILNRFSIMEI